MNAFLNRCRERSPLGRAMRTALINLFFALLSIVVLAIMLGSCTANAQTKMVSIGWEGTSMQDYGCNYFLPVNANITITGYSITCSVYPWNGAAAAALCTVSIGTGATCAPELTHYPTSFYLYGLGIFGSSVMVPNEGSLAHGDMGDNQYLMRTILKTRGADACVRVIEAHDLSVPVTAGSTIISHMDASGDDSDCEMQGVIYYQ
jgi:hypothetical protein